MPSSAISHAAHPFADFQATAPEADHTSGTSQFHVVPFRRDASGKIVPGTVTAAPNGDIAWRRARAAAFDHDNVGAAELRDGVLLASFGEVNPDALAG